MIMKKFTRNNATFNIENAALATKALPFVNQIENIGKNATVFKQIIKAIKANKTNVVYDFFVNDGLENQISKMALALDTQEKALKACKYDNLHQYQVAFKKWAKTPNAEMIQDDKDNVKKIVAKARILREGLFSKYAHGEISLNDLKIAFDLTSSKNPDDEKSLIENAPEVEAVEVEKNPEIDLSELTATLQKLDLDQARLMLEVLQGHINSLVPSELANAS